MQLPHIHKRCNVIRGGSFILICVVTAILVTACGGGKEEQKAITPPSVDALTAGAVMYSKQSLFTVSGSGLSGVSVTASGACNSLAEQAGGNTYSRTFMCSPTSIGNLTIAVAAHGTILKQVSFTVSNPQVTMITTLGSIIVELNPIQAPKTTNNFLLYVNDGFYNNTTFHRIVSGFVVQGGGYYANGTQKHASHPTLELEPPSTTGLTNVLGTIAMARTSALNSATSQFYFNTVDNNPNTGTSSGTNLDLPAGQGYAVFGNVMQGMDVIKAIEVVPVASNSVPITPVIVTSATQTL